MVKDSKKSFFVTPPHLPISGKRPSLGDSLTPLERLGIERHIESSAYRQPVGLLDDHDVAFCSAEMALESFKKDKDSSCFSGEGRGHSLVTRYEAWGRGW